MQWLESQINKLDQVESDYRAVRDLAANDESTYRSKEREMRLHLMENVNELVAAVAKRSGILGCLSCHDGLVIAEAGSLPDFDAVAAVTQEYLSAASKSQKTLRLGNVQQILVVGSDAKLAIITLGQIAVCIVCSKDTVLSAVFNE